MIFVVVVLLVGCIRAPGPPFMCRIDVPHAQYPSLQQERAQLDRANLLLQICMAQWEGSVDRRTFP